MPPRALEVGPDPVWSNTALDTQVLRPDCEPLAAFSPAAKSPPRWGSSSPPSYLQRSLVEPRGWRPVQEPFERTLRDDAKVPRVTPHWAPPSCPCPAYIRALLAPHGRRRPRLSSSAWIRASLALTSETSRATSHTVEVDLR